MTMPLFLFQNKDKSLNLIPIHYNVYSMCLLIKRFDLLNPRLRSKKRMEWNKTVLFPFLATESGEAIWSPYCVLISNEGIDKLPIKTTIQ